MAVLVAVGLAVLVPDRTPGLRPTNPLNVLFADRWVVGGVRLLGLVAGLYVLGSITVRVAQGQWLSRLGPADVETLVDVSEDQAELQRELDRARETIERLRGEYEALREEYAAALGLGHTDDAGRVEPGEQEGRTGT